MELASEDQKRIPIDNELGAVACPAQMRDVNIHDESRRTSTGMVERCNEANMSKEIVTYVVHLRWTLCLYPRMWWSEMNIELRILYLYHPGFIYPVPPSPSLVGSTVLARNEFQAPHYQGKAVLGRTYFGSF